MLKFFGQCGKLMLLLPLPPPPLPFLFPLLSPSPRTPTYHAFHLQASPPAAPPSPPTYQALHPHVYTAGSIWL